MSTGTPRDPEKNREYSRRWRAADPERAREANRQSHERNREERNARRRAKAAEARGGPPPEVTRMTEDEVKARRREDNRINIARYLFNSAKARAKKKGLAFTITKDDVVVPERCPYLDIEIQVCDGVHCDTSPSLDQIIAGGGYVPGNVEVISYRANAMKRDATPEELVMFAKKILERFQGLAAEGGRKLTDAPSAKGPKDEHGNVEG